MDLARRIIERDSGFLLFAVTPPRASTSRERAQEIADVTIKRLQSLDCDGLVLYDIDDESDRNAEERPFPFLPTFDPATYLTSYLSEWTAPVVVYRAVGKYGEDDLRGWLGAQDGERVLSVFVGASSRNQQVPTTLERAYKIRAEENPDLLLGGVAIPERHGRHGQEHLRLIAKQEAGSSFFVSQIIYDANAAKNLISDYHYECVAREIAPVPLVFTLSMCASMKTLRFLKWLGVDVPRWMENDLGHASDTLQASYQQALATARELIAYCRRLDVPFGLNVESVSIRREEIEAAVELAAELREELRR